MAFESRYSKVPQARPKFRLGLGALAWLRSSMGLMPDLAFGRKGFHATSRVAQALPREGGRARRFMKYHLQAPQPESGRRNGRKTRHGAKESQSAACVPRDKADSGRVGWVALAWQPRRRERWVIARPAACGISGYCPGDRG